MALFLCGLCVWAANNPGQEKAVTQSNTSARIARSGSRCLVKKTMLQDDVIVPQTTNTAPMTILRPHWSRHRRGFLSM